MTDFLDWGRDNAGLLIIFLLFWCAIYLGRIARQVDEMRGIMAVEESRRRQHEL